MKKQKSDGLETIIDQVHNYRRLSKDYEVLNSSNEAFIYMAMVDLMTKGLASTSTPSFRR